MEKFFSLAFFGCGHCLFFIWKKNEIPKEMAEMIFSKAYIDGHSARYYEVIGNAGELCDFINNLSDFIPIKDI